MENEPFYGPGMGDCLVHTLFFHHHLSIISTHPEMVWSYLWDVMVAVEGDALLTPRQVQDDASPSNSHRHTYVDALPSTGWRVWVKSVRSIYLSLSRRLRYLVCTGGFGHGLSRVIV